MKPYGYKKKKPAGDGCFLCTQQRKSTKNAVRSKAKKILKEAQKLARTKTEDELFEMLGKEVLRGKK